MPMLVARWEAAACPPPGFLLTLLLWRLPSSISFPAATLAGVPLRMLRSQNQCGSRQPSERPRSARRTIARSFACGFPFAIPAHKGRGVVVHSVSRSFSAPWSLHWPPTMGRFWTAGVGDPPHLFGGRGTASARPRISSTKPVLQMREAHSMNGLSRSTLLPDAPVRGLR